MQGVGNLKPLLALCCLSPLLFSTASQEDSAVVYLRKRNLTSPVNQSCVLTLLSLRAHAICLLLFLCSPFLFEIMFSLFPQSAPCFLGVAVSLFLLRNIRVAIAALCFVSAFLFVANFLCFAVLEILFCISLSSHYARHAYCWNISLSSISS